MTNKLNVQAIFDGIDGECNCFQGAGQLSTFIRLKGCNLNCNYCDTLYAQNSQPENWMTIDEIIEQIHFSKITITGGEPLVQKEGLIDLLFKLRMSGIVKQVSVETNGSIEIPFKIEYHKGTPHHITDCTFLYDDKIRWVVDFKLPSSGMTKYMNSKAFNCLREVDVIKFVISNKEDYDFAICVIFEHYMWKAKKVFSPAVKTKHVILANTKGDTECIIDMEWPRQLVEMMIHNKVDAQFSLQLHKIVWPGAKQER